MTMLEERVSSIEGAYDHIATKADLERLRGELRTEIETMRGDLLSEIRASEVRMIKWVAGLMIGTALGTVTAVAALLRLFL